MVVEIQDKHPKQDSESVSSLPEGSLGRCGLHVVRL